MVPPQESQNVEWVRVTGALQVASWASSVLLANGVLDSATVTTENREQILEQVRDALRVLQVASDASSQGAFELEQVVRVLIRASNESGGEDQEPEPEEPQGNDVLKMDTASGRKRCEGPTQDFDRVVHDLQDVLDHLGNMDEPSQSSAQAKPLAQESCVGSVQASGNSTDRADAAVSDVVRTLPPVFGEPAKIATPPSVLGTDGLLVEDGQLICRPVRRFSKGAEVVWKRFHNS